MFDLSPNAEGLNPAAPAARKVGYASNVPTLDL